MTEEKKPLMPTDVETIANEIKKRLAQNE